MWVGFLELLDIFLRLLWGVLLGGRVIIIVDDMLNVLGLLERVDELDEQVWIQEDGLCVRLQERVLQALLSQCIIGCDDGHALALSAVSGGQPVGMRRSKEVHAVALLHAQCAEPTAHVERELFILGKGHVLVPRQLVVCPLLVDFLLLAVDRLLDLFGLLVQLDQLALAEGLCIAVLLTGALEDVVDGLDVGLGRRLELVEGADIAAGNGLAVDLFDAGDFFGKGRLFVHFGLRHQRAKVFARHDVLVVAHGWWTCCDGGRCVSVDVVCTEERIASN